MADQKSGLLFENLRKLINTIDELRDVGLQEYINLPRIAVVGTQSAGKSSLLDMKPPGATGLRFEGQTQGCAFLLGPLAHHLVRGVKSLGTGTNCGTDPSQEILSMTRLLSVFPCSLRLSKRLWIILRPIATCPPQL